ncbi:hypothetical protein [Psychroflexus sp. ALD_RP9]|uniref:hypothetical protein n=1 Tax=Psychroflexus sp. ALD_RP9 TaxID=2777186 RepID=UPI001A8DF41C|nr:hypothetical protein [Psychroflexus sp. ALD_RP9]QSS98226.1 hypothetical protein IMZ30_05775 [Psychroflexus sp. ALD_RP9]
MENKHKTFFTNPKKKHLASFGLLWLIGNGLLVLSITDLFTESFFQSNATMIYVLMIASTVVTAKLYFNYWLINLKN